MVLIMSRIGKQPINIPDGAKIQIDGSHVIVTGPLGQLERVFPRIILINQKNNQTLVLKPKRETKDSSALHGLSRALLANMVIGVTDGFIKELEYTGVGYRAQVEGDKVVLNVGFSHPVEMKTPEGINVETIKNRILIKGCDKETVGEFAAKIRAVAPPEPYKGKGIRYKDELVRRKVGKTVAKTEE